MPLATRAHVQRELGKRAHGGGGASGGVAWRTHHPIEFWGLNNHTWFGHLIDDVVSNSYRALRFVGDPTYGDLLYSEFTALQDWHYDSPGHYELFNMTTDPHQLVNLYYLPSTPQALKDELQRRLVQHWECAGDTCP